MISIDVNQAAAHLSRAIACPTVSHEDASRVDWAAFARLEAELRSMYPLFFSNTQMERFSRHAMLFRWRGWGEGQPVLFMAHQDVIEAQGGGWTHPPFSGSIADGFVWGRGALDMKGQLIALLEAAEILMGSGFTPEGDVYFSFGEDEEACRETSALCIARTLEERGLRFRFVLDENTNPFWDGADWGITCEIAALGVCEKGYGVVSVSARAEGGHSSIPPVPCATALSRTAAAALRIEKKPAQARLASPCDAMLDAMVPRMPLGWRILVKNRRVLGGRLLRRLTRTPESNALFRSTFALTMAEGAGASNVLPQSASMCFNIRIAPWDDAETLLGHMRRAAQDAEEGGAVSVEYEMLQEPTPIANLNGEGYALVRDVTRECFPDAVVVPGLMLAATDATYFSNLSDCVLRFTPFRCYRPFRHTVHAVDERISLASLEEGIDFFLRLMQRV